MKSSQGLKVAIETEFLSIIVQIFHGNTAHLSHALLISRLSGDVVRLTIPELCSSLDRVAAQKES